MPEKRIMREVLIERIWARMGVDDKLFLLTDDFGAIALDKIRKDFKDRFINVGIAEQNLVNLSVGLALEGFVVFAYGIAPFLVMRAYEQLRNLSMISQARKLNVNLIGVGAGLSYDMSGPSHHCLEDISILRTLPNFELFSPSDCTLVDKFVDFSIRKKEAKYIRLDGKPLPEIHDKGIELENGFFELRKGERICLVSTGYMTHLALDAADELLENNVNVGVIDFFLMKDFNRDILVKLLEGYEHVITIEEGFINKGGLDSLISNLLIDGKLNTKLQKLGFKDKYIFDNGDREYLHKLNGLGKEDVIKTITELLT